jgi:hypothetical protein
MHRARRSIGQSAAAHATSETMTATATPPYRQPSSPWRERAGFVVLSTSAPWSDATALTPAAPRRRPTGALFVATVLTLFCAVPVVLTATLAWLGSASSATPIVVVLVALVLLAAALARGGRARSGAPIRVRVGHDQVEVRRGQHTLAVCPLPGQAIAVQHFVSQGVAAMSLVAQNGERVVFWADSAGAHESFDASLPLDSSAGHFDVASFDKHVELRARSLAQLCSECLVRRRADASQAQRTRVAIDDEPADTLPEREEIKSDRRAR